MAPLKFELLAECTTTRARASTVHLVHHSVIAPVFMPVGTQGTLKGLTTEQLEKQLDCHIMLANTYHLGHRPGPELIDKAGGLHKFMQWPRALLTDSGGFQMVSLAKLSEVTEEGVSFQSPHDGSRMLLSPEHSMAIQHSIGADIVMQLDDVVHSSTQGPRLEEAMERSIRWLDRCVAAHKPHAETQNLFAIVQGGLNADLRTRCAEAMIQRDVPGFAVGGLSGGEAKDDFWRMVALTTSILPKDKPRYLMGVGFPVDLVVCTALGCDMFDCVYPTRTARFGTVLVPSGLMNLNLSQFSTDQRPIDEECHCLTCRTYTRAQLHPIAGVDAISSSLLTLHNLTYMLHLMRSMRQSIIQQQFPQFVRNFMQRQFPNGEYPKWVCDALDTVGIHLEATKCRMENAAGDGVDGLVTRSAEDAS